MTEAKQYEFPFKIVSFGFLFFFFSMLSEFIDRFYLDIVFDKLQLIFSIIAFVILYYGFKKVRMGVKKGK